MEEQERSLKAQNAALEKKQHESWVTVRQETRRMTEANTEMQTLRTRLTVAESKLAGENGRNLFVGCSVSSEGAAS
jgi:hypothetical protein